MQALSLHSRGCFGVSLKICLKPPPKTERLSSYGSCIKVHPSGFDAAFVWTRESEIGIASFSELLNGKIVDVISVHVCDWRVGGGVIDYIPSPCSC